MEADDNPDTRVFVSGLPPNLTSNQLGAHFAGRYQITDAVVIPDRQIGFVGFRNYTLAKSAIKYFDKTYIRMSKISVEMAKAVEIERTSTSQGIPKSKHTGQVKAYEPLPSDSMAGVGQPTSRTKSNQDSAFQPYAPVLGSNKRKREPQSNLQDNSTKPAVAVQALPAPPGYENGLPKSSIDEKEDRDLKRARKKEEKDRSERKADVEEQNGDAQEHEVDCSRKMKAKQKRKGAKADTTLSEGENVAPSVSEDLRKGLDMPEKQAKKKKKENKKKHKDASAIDRDRHNDRGDNRTAGREEQLVKLTNPRSQVDGDTKSRVEPINDDAFEPPEQSADQNKQQRRKSDITSDNEWLRAKTNRLLDLVDEAPNDTLSATLQLQEESNDATANQEVHITDPPGSSFTNPSTSSTHNTVSSNGRLFVRNLPFTAKVSDIERLFSKYGTLDEVHLVHDKAGSSKGIGYIHFSDNAVAKQALQGLDGKSFQGRLLHIMEAVDKRSHKLDAYEISKMPLKKQKALKRKIEAAGSAFNWNSMYMNPNAVLSSVADRLGVAKADLIDASSANAAVKQAHAETHVIQETKAFLGANGVNLDAFKQHERDDTIVLVKNFPFGTTVEELKALFGPYGEIVKFLLPPSGTTAIIRYARSLEGSQAMRHLAYRNLKGSVLYLEKGPKSLFDITDRPIIDKIASDGALTADQEEDVSGKAEESSSTIFIRNLDFATTTYGLTQAFKPLSGFLSAKVKTKVDPRRPQEVLSMGFGFAEFSSNQQARAALAAMNGHRLDNHELLIQISRKATDAAEEQRHRHNLKKAEAHKTKIIIKNLPFEATKKDVRALLGAYGQLRSVKVPQKFDRSTRGFAFADFVTAKEAENAMEALKDTHLLGRRLVLQFAEEESIDAEDEIRAIEGKVGRQTEIIRLNNMTGSARKKFTVRMQDDDQ